MKILTSSEQNKVHYKNYLLLLVIALIVDMIDIVRQEFHLSKV